MFGTIQKLVHRIRTAFGLSKKTFGGFSSKFRKPPQGMGQGNGAGPSIWSILSSTVFDELRSQGFSTQFCYSLSMGLYQLCGFSYVDDCDLIADGNNATEVHEKLCRMLEMWDELMEVNGAAIAPDKCWWYLVDFVWHGGKWKYRNAGNGKKVKVRDKVNQIRELKYLPYFEAKEMVGVHLAPNGNEKEQLDVLKAKASTWSRQMRCSPLDAQTFWTAMNRTIIKGLEFPLAATTLSETELSTVMSPILNSVLPRSGFSQKFPRSVVYGPIAFQGLGVTNLWDFQYCRHIQDIVDQTWRDTPTGKLIVVNLEAAKLEAGVFWHLFDNPVNITWFNTTSSWIIETYRYCKQREIVFEEPGEILRPQCEGDRAIMEILDTAGYTTDELVILNRCRIYSKVVSLSEMTTGSGTSILPCWFQQNRHRADTTYDWPNQGRPSKNDWNLWDTAIRTHIVKCLPVGPWTVSISGYLDRWKWFISEDKLFKKCGSIWESYLPGRQGRRSQTYYGYTRRVEGQPNLQTLKRTMVFSQGENFVGTGTRDNIIPREMKQKGTWNEILRRHPHSSWICEWMSTLPPESECCKFLYNGEARGVSDGSYESKKDICTAAWIIEFGPDLYVKGGGVVPGPSGRSNAYRGELGGLLGQLLIIYTLEQWLPPQNPYNIPIACDGESALYRSLTATREDFTSTHLSFDLVSQIMVLKEQIQGSIEPVHVKGHQDDEKISLSEVEILNVRMDTLAKEILEKAVISDQEVPDAIPLVSPGITQVDYQEIPICSSLASTLRSLISEDRAIAWWRYKGRFREGVLYNDVDWKVLGTTTTEMSFSMRRFVAKWTCHHIGVGRMMEFRRARKCNDCPRCGASEESTLHVLQCRSKDARKQWKKGIRRVEQWMRKSATRMDVRIAISAALRNFNRGENFDTYVPPTSSAGLEECLRAQSRIGWIGFLEGCLSPKWADLQEEHFQALDKRRSGRRWAVELSKQLWKLVFSMWDHRNSTLFMTSKIEELSGIQIVKNAIQQERLWGLGSLDPSFQPYLSLPLSSFFKNEVH